MERIVERIDSYLVAEKIKAHLIEDDGDSWNEFIDNQEMGDCQGIVFSIARLNLPNVRKVFGEIDIDDSYIDNRGKRQKRMVHHWITINGQIYEFSKGTLKDWINWDDLYDVDPEDPHRYHRL